MSGRFGTRAVVLLGLVGVVAVGFSAAFAPDAVLGGSVAALVITCLAFLTVGVLIVHRVAGNGVGWLLVGMGMAIAVGISAEALATLGEDTGLGLVARWIGTMMWMPLIAIIILLLAVFPAGRTIEGWWPVQAWCAAAFGAGAVVLNGFTPDLLVDYGLDNPFANPAIDRYGGVAAVAVAAGMLGGLAFGAASLIVRYRKGAWVERHQIKWFIFAAILLPPAMALADATQRTIGPLILGLAALAFPVAIAVAIFRYRLYEIDRIINRTVVYAIVVGLLGAVFVAGALWLPSLLPFESSSVAVAGSTLVVFFLFNPLRMRVQRFVDRRFYRSPYDAQEVADAFSMRLRDQVDPDAVALEWVEVVRSTLQPAAVSVWVREEA